jgi:hypothetical protein
LKTVETAKIEDNKVSLSKNVVAKKDAISTKKITPAVVNKKSSSKNTANVKLKSVLSNKTISSNTNNFGKGQNNKN